MIWASNLGRAEDARSAPCKKKKKLERPQSCEQHYATFTHLSSQGPKVSVCDSSGVQCDSRTVSSRSFQRYPGRPLAPTGSQITRGGPVAGDP